MDRLTQLETRTLLSASNENSSFEEFFKQLQDYAHNWYNDTTGAFATLKTDIQAWKNDISSAYQTNLPATIATSIIDIGTHALIASKAYHFLNNFNQNHQIIAKLGTVSVTVGSAITAPTIIPAITSIETAIATTIYNTVTSPTTAEYLKLANDRWGIVDAYSTLKNEATTHPLATVMTAYINYKLLTMGQTVLNAYPLLGGAAIIGISYLADYYTQETKVEKQDTALDGSEIIAHKTLDWMKKPGNTHLDKIRQSRISKLDTPVSSHVNTGNAYTFTEAKQYMTQKSQELLQWDILGQLAKATSPSIYNAFKSIDLTNTEKTQQQLTYLSNKANEGLQALKVKLV